MIILLHLFRSRSSQRGDIAVYISLLLLLSVSVTLLMLSNLLANQIRSGNDIIDSERAMYAVDSGLEAAFYCTQVQPADFSGVTEPCALNETLGVTGSIEYSDGSQAEYNGLLFGIDDGSGSSSAIIKTCSKVLGEYGGKRRLLGSRGGIFIDSDGDGEDDSPCGDIEKYPDIPSSN